MFDAIKSLGSEIPDKKKWIDVITATLTIPVLLTVIIANVNNIKSKDVKGTQTTPTPIQSGQAQAPLIVREIITSVPTATTIPTPTQSISVTPSCKLDPQPYEISYPKENSEINVDPVCAVMEQQDSGYCETSWAYRVNNSTWSSYTKDPICLYNMANGPIKLEIRTKNTTSGRETTYTRNFNYQKEEVGNPASSTPTETPSITP